MAWGANEDGQCDVPAPNSGFVAMAAKNAVHSIGLKADGTIVAWGNNDDGQCDVPDPNSDFIAVSVGHFRNSLAVRTPPSPQPGDWDGDGDVDLDDYDLFELCLSVSGPGITPPFSECIDVHRDLSAFEVPRCRAVPAPPAR
ncbi:MAG: hypothetical protein ACYSUI_15955 [Planctomycetota bacterium]